MKQMQILYEQLLSGVPLLQGWPEAGCPGQFPRLRTAVRKYETAADLSSAAAFCTLCWFYNKCWGQA